MNQNNKKLGTWIRQERIKKDQTLGDMVRHTRIRFRRLLELEMGEPQEGITPREAKIIGAVLGYTPWQIREKLEEFGIELHKFDPQIQTASMN